MNAPRVWPHLVLPPPPPPLLGMRDNQGTVFVFFSVAMMVIE